MMSARPAGGQDAASQSATFWVALLCLVGAGAMLGLSTNLAKVAATLALSPLTFLTWSAAGAALILLLVAGLRGHLPPVNGQTVRYSLIAGLVSLAAPNLIAFAAAPQIGVGFVALMIALPPLLTYSAAVALGMERFDVRRALAVVLALAGALWIAIHKLTSVSPQTGWILLTSAIPIILAIGNIYRSRTWPQGLRPDALSPAMLVAAVVLLLVFGRLTGLPGGAPMSAGQYGLIAIQSAVFAVQYLLFFILQQRGGPVLLSLMGAVAAIIGVPIAVLVLDERTPEGLLIGGTLIAAGVLLMAASGLRGPVRG